MDDEPPREELLFGTAPQYTQQRLADLAGVTLEQAQNLWTALGFALPDPADVAFTDADLEALRTFTELRDAGVVAPHAELALTRALGQTMARLAEWQVGILQEYVAAQGGADGELARQRAASSLVGPMEQLQQYVWRRHLIAANDRASVAAAGEQDVLGVGFADVVGFTSLSRGLEQDELTEFVEGFEAASADIIARHGGRVVKTIGDEVMFTADTATAAADIGLALADRFGDEHSRSDLRVGIAYGPVVRRLGDVYGTVVNMAARLTALARPGTVLADRALGTILTEFPGYSPRKLRWVSVRGFEHLQPWVVRRASPHR